MVNVNDQQQQHRRILNVFESRNVILFLTKKKEVKMERRYERCASLLFHFHRPQEMFDQKRKKRI